MRSRTRRYSPGVQQGVTICNAILTAGALSPNTNIGKADGQQTKVQFDARRSTHILSSCLVQPGAKDPLREDPDNAVDMRMLLMVMQKILMSIEAKIDIICTRMDSITHNLENKMVA
ncbi:hypothetical protein NDU88_004915 [Pleurodeles waltl]|uniref:Uncharacterized protein n=1 Tax=Pleurodeles waltl TaxID=8319 RepID=A0AAV7QFT5_PLEWA|nr:hypothetical protein NDU88_004915 [Pleurodeles waltl]